MLTRAKFSADRPLRVYRGARRKYFRSNQQIHSSSSKRLVSKHFLITVNCNLILRLVSYGIHTAVIIMMFLKWDDRLPTHIERIIQFATLKYLLDQKSKEKKKRRKKKWRRRIMVVAIAERISWCWFFSSSNNVVILAILAIIFRRSLPSRSFLRR